MRLERMWKRVAQAGQVVKRRHRVSMACAVASLWQWWMVWQCGQVMSYSTVRMPGVMVAGMV